MKTKDNFIYMCRNENEEITQIARRLFGFELLQIYTVSEEAFTSYLLLVVG